MLLKNFVRLLTASLFIFILNFTFINESLGNTIDSVEAKKLHYKLSYIFEDDNYLLSLKNVVKLKDGNDYGYTYSLAFNGSVTKRKNTYSVKYYKALYTKNLNDSLGETMIGLNSKTKQKLKLVHVINIEKLMFGFQHESKLIYKVSFGFEHRGRTNKGYFSATNIQSIHHQYLLKVAGFYYCQPNGEAASNVEIIHPAYSKEKLTDAISEVSILANLSIGKNKTLPKYKTKICSELGSFLSSEKSILIGQNSNIFGRIDLQKSFGKKSKFTTTLSQNLKYYSPCNATSKNLGYVETFGISYLSKYKKIKLLPSLSFFKPFGRLDFHDFNDNDINVLIKLDIDF
ncbi:MAG: hypothetical protein RL065_2111 [Bacteroidota bacterium]|jgi:hypothetical protein